jgi:hypothetical protein
MCVELFSAVPNDSFAAALLTWCQFVTPAGERILAGSELDAHWRTA